MAWFLGYKEVGVFPFLRRIPLDVKNDRSNETLHEAVMKAHSIWQRITSCVSERKFFDPEVVWSAFLIAEDKSDIYTSVVKPDPVHDPDPTAEQ